VKSAKTFAALAVVATIAAAGCGRSGNAPSTSTSTSAPAGQASGGASFGSLTGVCQPGHPSGAPDQGVTASQITAGVLTDAAFTKDQSLVTAANVFTSWCNAAGGINGRKLVANIGQTNLLAVVPAMTTACGQDFMLVGNSEALDGIAVQTRLKCLLPEFPAQVVMLQNINSALQVYPLTDGHSYAPFTGYYSWLIHQAYPDSAKHVGILFGQSPITAPILAANEYTLRHIGATLAYSGPFPATGVSDWTPYAQAIKSKGIKGLTFYGEPSWLASFEQTLTNMNYKLDWIDANSNSYGPAFISLAGKSLSYQHNYAALQGLYPLEKASSNPASAQLESLYAKYAPGQQVTLQALQAWSAWLLFAKSAASCGNNVTRKCVYDAGLTQTAWTGGGLQAPVNLSQPDSPDVCFNVEQATATGWQPASFGANSGAYRCDAPVFKVPAGLPQPLTLADVGKSMANLK
jgi:hypothetical protein